MRGARRPCYRWAVVKRGLLLIAFVAGIGAGCAHGHFVVAPDGEPATVVTCRHHSQSKCYAKASRICPWGYQVLDAPPGSLLFRCGSYPDAPGPDQEQEQEQEEQVAPDTSPRPPEEKLYRT